MKKTVLAILGLAMTTTSFVSCSEDLLTNESQSTVSARNGKTMRFDDFFFRKKEIAMRDFSEALLKVISENKEVRELIKTEALKQFNNDTEVLALYLVEQNIKGQPLFNLFEKHLQGKTSLREIFQIVPTLTILVPELPEDSFSAKKWDTNSQLPNIAIRTGLSNNIPVIGLENNNILFDVIPSDIIPGDPVLVVKDNERVLSSQSNDFNNLKTRTFFHSRLTGKIFKFKDTAYDPLYFADFLNTINSFKNKIYEAYHITNNTNLWQRDHIYYGINYNNPNGVYDHNYKECLVYIEPTEYNGSAYGCYKKMSDHTADPSFNATLNADNKFTNWTDGIFEIVVYALQNNSNKEGGVATKKSISVDPNDIFELKYKHHSIPHNIFWKKNIYTLEKVKARRLEKNWDLFIWKLDEIGTNIKVVFEEHDTVETHNKTYTNNSKIATNFSYDVSFGEKIKNGIKFGASGETSKSFTHTINSTKGSNELGDSKIYFGEPIIINNNYKLNSYTTGEFTFSVAPVKITE